MYEIIFPAKVLKQLEKLEKTVQQRITSTLERVRIRPEVHLIKLVGDPGYKLRIGDYRLYIDLNKTLERIEITKIGHRKSIYKK